LPGALDLPALDGIDMEGQNRFDESTPGGEAAPRRLQRFFVAGPLAPGMTVDVGEHAQQLTLVLRMQVGDELLLLDGSGQEFHARIAALSRHAASVHVLAGRPCLAEPKLHLSLYQCSLKQDKFEWVLQKGTELGVSRFVPVIAERSVVRPAAALLNKYARWTAIVREAAEQCGRARVPEIGPPLEWAAAVASRTQAGVLAWEEASNAPSLAAWLQEQGSALKRLSILIGPEGGVTAREAQAAVAQGWKLVSLGPRILRAETAAVTAAALAAALLQ
jgi:16S rRNA (uracil1498-N3)-methyltransferase